MYKEFNEFEYERLHIIFIKDEYELKIEVLKSFSRELEKVEEEEGLFKMIEYLGENKDKYIILSDVEISDLEFSREIDCSEDFIKETNRVKALYDFNS